MESKLTLKIKDPEIAQNYAVARNREILFGNLALTVVKIIMFLFTMITSSAPLRNYTLGEYLIRILNMPIHAILLVIGWKCSPKFYIIHGPILTIIAAFPALYLLY